MVTWSRTAEWRNQGLLFCRGPSKGLDKTGRFLKHATTRRLAHWQAPISTFAAIQRCITHAYGCALNRVCGFKDIRCTFLVNNCSDTHRFILDMQWHVITQFTQMRMYISTYQASNRKT
jgi:hypothetical protein